MSNVSFSFPFTDSGPIPSSPQLPPSWRQEETKRIPMTSQKLWTRSWEISPSLTCSCTTYGEPSGTSRTGECKHFVGCRCVYSRFSFGPPCPCFYFQSRSLTREVILFTFLIQLSALFWKCIHY